MNFKKSTTYYNDKQFKYYLYHRERIDFVNLGLFHIMRDQ